VYIRSPDRSSASCGDLARPYFSNLDVETVMSANRIFSFIDILWDRGVEDCIIVFIEE